MKRILSITLVGLTILMFVAMNNSNKVEAMTISYEGLISLGLNHTIAITKEGEVYTWGRNQHYQLGDGTNTNSNIPIDITSRFTLNTNEVLIAIETGGNHSAALTSDGRLFMWGDNAVGQLGDNTAIEKDIPTDITANFNLNAEETIIDIDLGLEFSSAITSEGRVFTWGGNEYGQLGNSTGNYKDIPDEITSQFGLASGETIISIELGSQHAIAISSEDRVFTWGRNYNGGLGDNTTVDKNVPTEITSQFGLASGETVIHIAAGEKHTIASTSENRVFTWGKNDYNQLGDGTTVDKHVPTDITTHFSLASGEGIVNVEIGYEHTGAVTSTGRVFTWGSNSYDRLGTGVTGDQEYPYDITSNISVDTGEVVVYMDLGYIHSSIITSRGNLYLWGWNDRGQLGDGTNDAHDTAIKIGLSLSLPDTTPPTFDTIEDQTIEEGSYANIDWSTYITNEQDDQGGELVKVEVEDNVLYDTPGTYSVTVMLIDVSLNETEQTFNVTVTEIVYPDTFDRTYIQYDEDGFEYYEDLSFIQVSLGGNHSSALTLDGRIFTWGRNEYGELGDGTLVNKVSPTEITDQFTLNVGETITKIALGSRYSAALTSEGRIFTWGYNLDGALGDGTTSSRNTPTDITNQFNLGSGEKVIEVDLGYNHSSAITSEGRVFTWGWNGNGQIGDDTTSRRTTPTDITSNFNLNAEEIVTQLSLGYYDSSAITSEGRTFTWGYNNYGQLGDGTLIDKHVPTDITSQFGLNTEEIFSFISLGQYFSSVLTSEGRVFTWGYNNNGQLGNGTTTDVDTPAEITNEFDLNNDETVIEVEVRYAHSSALTSEGRVFSWGYNGYGELGDGTIDSKTVPTDITSNFIFNNGDYITGLSLGYNHSAALSSEGKIYLWGLCLFGQLGDGTTDTSHLPQSINFGYIDISEAPYYRFTEIHNGNDSVVAITIDNRIFTWGDNEYGQLGDGTTVDKNTPIEITSQLNLNEGESIAQVSAGSYHVAIITSDNRLIIWGSNSHGQLGDGTQDNYLVPTDITSFFSLDSNDYIKSVDLGTYSSAIITNSGRVFTWGLNQHGQLGDGTTIDKDAPTEITSDFPLNEGEVVNSIYLGLYHAGALTSENRMFMWGWNVTGQLGDDTYSSKAIPTDMTSYIGLNSGEIVTQIDLSSFHSSLITSENRVFTWGSNEYGKLGGSTTTPEVPNDITANFGLNTEEYIIEVQLGYYHSSALSSDGRVFTWGRNEYGESGDNSAAYSTENIPVDITSFINTKTGEKIIDLETGQFHMVALSNENSIFTWGYNINGQLGDGTNTNRFAPVLILENDADISNVEYIEILEGTTVVDNVEYLTFVVYPQYHISPYVHSLTINGVEYTDFITYGGIIKVRIPNIYELDEVVYFTLESYKLYNDTVIMPTGITSGKAMITDTTPPTFDTIPTQTIEVIEFIDIDWTTYIQNLEDDSDGVITLSEIDNVMYEYIGTYQVTVTATDASGNFTSQTFDVNVLDTIAPILFYTGEQTFEVNSTPEDFTYLFMAIDTYDTNISINLTVVDNTDFTQVGVYTVTATVYDAARNTSVLEIIITIVDTTPPTFDTIDTQYIEIIESDIVENEVEATTLVIHYNRPEGDYEGWNIWLWGNNCGYDCGEGFEFDGEDSFGKMFSLELVLSEFDLESYDQIGIIIRLSDEGSDWVQKDIELDRYVNMKLTNIDGEVHIYIVQGVLNIKQGEIIFDFDWTTLITNALDNSDSVLTKIEVEDNVDYTTPGTYSVTVKVVDESGNEISQTFDVVVEDEIAPIFDMIYNQVIEAGEFTDIDWETYIKNESDNSFSLIYKVEVEDNVEYNTPGNYIVTVKAVDLYGNETRQSFTVTVEDTNDTIPPTFDTIEDQHINIAEGDLSENVAATTLVIHYYRPDGDYDGWNMWLWGKIEGVSYGGEGLEFDDEDSFGMLLSFDLSLAEFDLLSAEEIGIIIRLSDESDDWVEKDILLDRYINMTITNIDGEVHVYLTQGVLDIKQGELTFNIDWTPYITNELDNSGGTLTKVEVEDNINYMRAGTYTVTVSLVDESGNITSQTFNVTVVDSALPTFDTIADQTIEASEYLDIDWTTYIENERDNSYYYLSKIEAGDYVVYDTAGTYTVSVLVVDESGNSTSQTFNVTVTESTVTDIEVTLNKGIDTIFTGDTHIDAGVTVTDGDVILADEDVTIDVANLVNNATLGEYIITYTITGDNIDEIVLTRYVNVLEKDKEIIFTFDNDKTTYKVDDNLHNLRCTVKVDGVEQDCLELSNNADTSTTGVYEVVYYIDVDGIRYTKTRYVFVYQQGTDLTLYYRKEEEVLI